MESAREDLRWWMDQIANWNGKSLEVKEVSLTIKSDASLLGWGTVCSGQRTEGPWSNLERQMYINCLDLLVITLAVQKFTKHKRGIAILVMLDNTTSVLYINTMDGTISPVLTNLARSLWLWCLDRDIQLRA